MWTQGMIGVKDSNGRMVSVCDVAEEVIDYLDAMGQKVGLVKVRLYRPWSPKALLKVLPKSVKKGDILISGAISIYGDGDTFYEHVGFTGCA